MEVLVESILPVESRFDAKDVQLLKEMIAEGSDIHIQVVPTQQKYEIEKVIEKLEFNE